MFVDEDVGLRRRRRRRWRLNFLMETFNNQKSQRVKRSFDARYDDDNDRRCVLSRAT